MTDEKSGLNQLRIKLEKRTAQAEEAAGFIRDLHEVVMTELIPKKMELFRQWLVTPAGPKRNAIKEEMDAVTAQIKEAHRNEREWALMRSIDE